MVKLSTIFEDIIDMLHETAEKASAAYDISVVFEDLDGLRITKDKDDADKYFFCEICKNVYSKRNVDGARLCSLSDREASWNTLGMKIDIPYFFACHCGFSNFLIPIKIGGSVAGNVFGGQFIIQRGSEKKATRRWTEEQRKSILGLWESRIPAEIQEQYKTGVESFLMGPEGGGFPSIEKFLSNINEMKATKRVSADTNIIDKKMFNDMRRAVYGLDIEEEIRSLLSACFKDSRYLLEKFDKLKASGAELPAPRDEDEKIGNFLDRLKPENPDHVKSTMITDYRSRQDFIRRFNDDIAFYKRTRNFRAKDLPTILTVIEKLYSEAQILSQLGNERLYLKLYEGLTSRIPAIIENECKMEIEWISKKMPEIRAAIGNRNLKAKERPEIDAQKMNENFFAVLARFEEYQHRYSRRFWRRFDDYSKINGSGLISNFLSKYLHCLSWHKHIGEEIDRCERIYLSVILRLQGISKAKVQKENDLSELKERLKTTEREKIDAEENAEELIGKELKALYSRMDDDERELDRLDLEYGDIDKANEIFLKASYECRKVNEQFESALQNVRKSWETGLALQKSDVDELKKSLKELGYVLTLLRLRYREMKANLEILEATDKKAYYNRSVLEDKFSIAIISLKDKFIEGLLWVNQCISELTKTEHKKDFHIRFDTMYFNVAGLAPVHTFIEQAQQRWMIQRDESGAVSTETEKRIERELKITRKYISLLLGVDKEEIILTDSTTEGISLALQAIHFKNGDQIITSNAEHDAVRYVVSDMIKKSKAFYGVSIDWEEDGYPEDKIVEHVTSRTRLVLFSHILFTTGDQLNAKTRISQWRAKYKRACKRNPENKSYGILFLVDGAQSAGQTPLDLEDMDCDFFAMDGHKWLLASEGSGALYARKCFLEGNDSHIHFTFIKNYMVVDGKTGFHPKDKYGRPYELATINLPSKIGLQTAVQMIARDGFAKLVGMSERLEEEDASSICRVLDACFNDHGEAQEINTVIAYLEKEKNAQVTNLKGSFEIKDESNHRSHKTEDAVKKTEEFLKECLGQGIRDIRDKIADLKDYFRERLTGLEKELQNNKSSKLTVRVVTRERNEGGVVGFQLIDKTTDKPVDVSDQEGKHDYEIHKKLGDMLEKDYGIIFRVIPPPYPPAIRVSLHKYNTRSEIDIMYQALLRTIPLMT